MENKIHDMLAHGPVTSAAMRRNGIPSTYVCRMLKTGQLVRLSRGVYTTSETEFDEYTDMAAASLATNGVICLFSALKFHGITVENPHSVWITLRNDAHPPRTDWPEMQFIYKKEPMFSSDVEHHCLNNTPVKIYSAARTITDCFQFRNKIGLDVAIAALKDAVVKNKVNANSLWETAARCRMTKIMRPYMEAVL